MSKKKMKKEHITLITTPIENSIIKNKSNILFLGAWCKINLNEELLKQLKYSEIIHPWKNKAKQHSDFEYLKKTYNYFCLEISLYLNKIHKLQYSQSYWEQIIGFWVLEFLTTIFEKYIIIKNLKDSNNITAYEVVNKKDYTKKNSYLSKEMYCSDAWNNYIFLFLIKRFKKNIKIKQIKSSYLKKNNSNVRSSIHAKFNFKNKFKKFGISFFSYFAYVWKKKNEIFIINCYLGFINEIILQFKVNRLLKINTSYENKYKYTHKLDKKIRDLILKKNKGDDKFITLIKEIIIKNIPLAYIEEYKSINQFNQKLPWPTNPRKILTSVNNVYDDPFKVWLADKKEKGAELIYTQHGGKFLLKSNCQDYYLSRTCQKIVVWGKRQIVDKNFYFALFNIKSSGKEFKIKKNSFILIPQEFPRIYVTTLSQALHFNDYKNYINKQNNFLNNLDQKNYAKIIIRFGAIAEQYSGVSFLEYEKKTWLKLHQNITYENRDNPVAKTIERSYLTIITNINATLLLECLSSNIPFLILTSNYKHMIRKNCWKDFEIFELNNILFCDPAKLAKFINTNNAEDILKWWYSKKIQSIIKKFQKNYAAVNHQPTNTLKNFLNN